MEANNQTENSTQQQQQQQISSTGVVEVSTDGFTKVLKNKRPRIEVTPTITLDAFKRLFGNEKIVFYNKKGRQQDFENDGVCRRYSEEVKDSTGKVRTRHVVITKTYLHLTGDRIIYTWDNDEVIFYTQLGHPDLDNWGGKMYWEKI